MFLDSNANLKDIAGRFSCTIFFGDPELMAKQFPASPRTMIFEKDAKKSGITVDVSQELVRLNIALAASTDESPNFLIVKNAELLNANASNALLKTLEEARQHFVLLASPRAQILPTILSRSAVFYLPATKSPSKKALDTAKLNIVEMAAAVDKKPELALEVLNVLAQMIASSGVVKIAPSSERALAIRDLTSIANAILAGNNPKLAFLSFL
ncbi:hypothetical protein FWC63_01145 [Candidatus Saccharibacteria bacterium]|nr:hypothetical protein [Candidatus Saccharibacteria bacterium]